MRLFPSLSLSIALAASMAAGEIIDAIPRESRQLVFVVAAQWTDTRGALQRYEREPGGAWTAIGGRREVLLGRGGLGWGLGLSASAPGQPGPVKREGDQRSPAGVFALPSAFGHEPRTLRLPYRVAGSGVEAVDDPASRYYNRIVRRAEIAHPDWHSSEKMDALAGYSLGIVVGHNPRNLPGAGSCIFIHLWQGDRRGTAGCTVLRERDLIELAEWLDARRLPVLVQLPRGAVPAGFP